MGRGEGRPVGLAPTHPPSPPTHLGDEAKQPPSHPPTSTPPTLVMKESSGSTLSLVACMMKASQVDLSARSSS